MKDKVSIQTKLGTLEVKIDRDEKYPGLCLELNGVPILEVEQVVIDGEYMIVLKRYPNKKVFTDDEHFNMDKFHIDIDLDDKDLIKDILKGMEN